MTMITPAPTAAACESSVVQAMNDPILGWTRSRAMRRRLVPLSLLVSGLFVACMPQAGAAKAAGARGTALVWLGVSLVLGIVWMLITGFLNASVRGTADPLVAHLPGGHDERQRGLYATALRRCYWPMLVLWSVATVTMVVTKPSVAIGLTIFFASFLLTLMAPLWLLAWTLPDEEFTDEA